MKRPIAELLTMTLKPGSAAERAQYEQEAWQILRRKQGYVTHRVYQQIVDPLQRLVYSEWESKKAVDGARQYLQGTPLMRRARAVLADAPRRLIVELAGPITSTKGLDLPGGAIAALALARTANVDAWLADAQPVWKIVSSQPGHITHVLFYGLDDPGAVGSLSHWQDTEKFAQALTHTGDTTKDAAASDPTYVQYRLAAD